MSATPRVLFVAPVEPWCRENGSSVIIADLLEGLAASSGAELLPLFLRPPPDGYVPRPPARYRGELLNVPGLPRWLSVAGAALRGSSPLRMRFHNAKAARLLLDAARRHTFVPTVVHVEHLPLVDMGRKLARIFRCPLVYRAHNIESELWARRLGMPGMMGRAVIRQMRRSEADAIRISDLTLCISDVDLDWARANAPGAATELLPCSLLLDRYDAIKTPPGDNRQICFVGGLDWVPNEVGLQWFVTEVMPLVVAEIPEAQLAVLARGAAERAWLTGNPSVRIVPAESSAAELFAASKVSVAPLLSGGGVRIKIPESMALGCPVVATPIGAEGHDLPALTRTDSPPAFAAACIRHLREPRSPESRQAMRAAVQARYGASVLAETLIGHWSRLARA